MSQSTYIRDGFVSAGNAQITGSLGVTGGITGSLQGTASYATQALSASYAPSAGGAAFPFTGSAIITGSLNVTGSLNITGSTTITNGALILSSSATSTYVLRTKGDSVYILDNYGLAGRAFLAIGVSGVQLHNAGNDPTINFPAGGNINAATTLYSSATSHIFYGGTNKQVSIGTAAVPTAKLHIAAGAAAATSAPIKLTAGTNMTTPEAGAVEFDGTNLFFTTGSTRQIAVAATSALTSSRIPFATTNGRLTDSSKLTYGATADTLHVEGSSGNTLFELTRAGEITYKYNINSSNVLNITNSTSDSEYYFARGNKFGIGVSATARLHIVAGTATANTAPIKLTTGTNLTTPEAGTIEFNGNNLFFTTGSTRSTILTNTNPASITGNVSVTGTLSSTAKYILGSDLSLIPIAGNQSVLTSWWGLQIVGNKQSTVDYTPSAIGNNSDFSVIIPNQQAAKIGLIVRGQTSQTGNLLELRNVSNTGLSAFDSTGQLALGKTTPTAVLDVNGNARITGSLLVNGSSLVAGYNPTPLEGTIQDGVTSILGNLNDWDSNFYQGTVLYSEIAGGTITFGQLCYRTNAETWALADATAIASSATHMLGICVKSSTATNPTSILINGFVETTNYATILKSGEPLYMATTPGSITKTAPTTAGNIVRLIGNTFWDSNSQGMIVIHFNPDRSWIEL